jgi:heptosyltransferase-3
VTLPPRARILVVTLQRLGDVLLTTPLIRSLKRAYPDAGIDALVFAGTEGILAGNPDIGNVITMPQRASALASGALLARLFRRYDIAISTQAGDRPTLFAVAAARRSVGLVDPRRLNGRIKAALLTHPVAVTRGEHRVREVLRLAEALGVSADTTVVPPTASSGEARARKPYAVVHVAPMFRYKQWTADGWRALAAGLTERGLAVIATGGPDAVERRYLDEVWAPCPNIERLDGKLSWGELADTIRNADVFIGPDTAVTHLAVATGTATVALYGPTDPRLWGPWPQQDPDWAAAGTIQERRNVWLVQNPLPCLPCQNEGCLRRIDSYSQCLDELPASQVLAAVDAALVDRAAGAAVADRAKRR